MAELREGDTVQIVQRRKDHSVRLYARVSWAEEKEAGTYFGYVPVEPPKGKWGLRPHEAGAWGASWLRREPLPFSPQVTVVGR